jgi:MFS family permease
MSWLTGKHFQITFTFFMAMVGLSMAFVAAEVVPLFLITLFTVIAYDLNAGSYVIWIIVSQFIAIAAVAPFVGTIADLIGRRSVVLIGLACTVVAMIIIGTVHNISGMIAGQVMAGVGIGIQLLTTVAAATELVPTNKRGSTIGYIVCGFTPFAAASLYGQYLASHSWRWVSVLVGIWAILAFIVLAIFYHPPPRVNSEGLSKREIVKRIDFVGSFLSLAGIILFLTGLNWGGQSYPWKSGHVIGTMVAGGVTTIIFFLWEKFGTKYPMFPMALARSPRPFIAVSVLALTSGIK